MKKIKAAILGTGNIGTDLLIKLMRSECLECSLFAGTNPESKNIARANLLGVQTSADSIDAIKRDPGCCDIVFDATNAESHVKHAKILKGLGKFAIDLTPSEVGEMCIPALNMEECLRKENVNMVTCGGQASIPIAHVLKRAYPDIEYIEVVASIASKSAGPGTRVNIDEYVETTEDGLKKFTGARETKAILNLNPAVPPIHMHNTIYAETKTRPDLGSLRAKTAEMAKEIRKYVPGYKIILEPVYENGIITTMLEVYGLGDHLPQYAGNLDIITCAAVAVAEGHAKMLNGKRGK